MKYISLNQFGVGFNICNMFTQISKIQTSLLNGISDVQKQQLDHKKNLKYKYQKQFENLLARMGQVIQDFLQFQIEFKRQYFGFNIVKPQNNTTQKKMLRSLQSPAVRHAPSENSVNSGESINKKPPSYSRNSRNSHHSSQQEDQKKQTQIQKKLREILKRKLAPQKQNIIKFCNMDEDPRKNISKLQQKIDMMQSEIILSRARQQKIIQIFNKRRIQNLQPKGQNLIHCELIQTDDGKNIKQLNASSSQRRINNYNLVKEQNHSDQKIKEDFKKKQSLQKPNLSLNFQQINCPKYRQNENEPTTSSTIYGQATIKSPKKLISPKSFKNHRQANNTFNFFNSPKNTGLLKKTTNINFKKKKDQQNQIDQSNNHMEEVMQDDIKDNKEKEYPINSNNNIINKNRSIFMRRRSNNQSINPGEVNID